ncbi:DUF3263 domain-containing protein [Micromonospora avicenniae]|uniref:DUF3263 domain-containing protein n=1 Tax=Micromonospora avicenniae TaxID=1198245 RepID=A0A1N6QUF8_9ACTN|nr:DUF3263 domain-containing protein [Micromonospora avicenniae]SIQ20223.1 Protein of unknown function [Micromonospora avicenniae]
MQPADAAPAAAEPPADDRDHRVAARPVPPPRSAPAVEAVPGDEVVEPAISDDSLETTADAGGGSVADAARPELTERELAVLAFEQQWWRHAGAKEQAIRDTFGVSATRYYQLLNGLLDNPAALAAEPVLIGRLRRLRSSRARNRRG